MLNNVLAIIGVIAAIFGIVIPIYKYLIDKSRYCSKQCV